MKTFTVKMKATPCKVLKRKRTMIKGKAPVETTQPETSGTRLQWPCILAAELIRLRLERTSRNSHLSPWSTARFRPLIYFILLTNCASESTTK